MDERETLGRFLKSQRESKGVSLKEIAKSIKVRENILHALEEDQYDLLPPSTYVKGFLLSYAKYLKLDPNEVLLRYESLIKKEPIHLMHIPSPSKTRERMLWDRKQILIVIGVLLGSILLFYFFFPFTSHPPVEPILSKSTLLKPTLEEKPSTPSISSETLPPPISEKKTFSLRMKAEEETWVSFQIDDQVKRVMTFKPGGEIFLQATNYIHIIVGNAGGLQLIYNENPLERLGESGEVVTLHFTSEGMEIKRHRKPNPPSSSHFDRKGSPVLPS